MDEKKGEDKFTVPSVGRDENENIIHDFHRIKITGDEVISVRRQIEFVFLSPENLIS